MKERIHEPYMKLKGFIREKGINYDEIAKLLGITVTTVSQKINGNSDFYLSEAEKIKSAYNATNDIFL